MGVALNTAGVTVGYVAEATAGTRPTTGYTLIPEIKEIPSFNPAPDTLETTVLSETDYKTYIFGLKDLGGSLTFKANYNDDLITAWETMVTAYEALTGGKGLWIEIKHPSLTKSVFFKAQPSDMGVPAMGVNQILETELFLAPLSAPIQEAKSTVA